MSRVHCVRSGLGSLAAVCQDITKRNDQERRTLGDQNARLENRVRALEQDKAKLTAQVRMFMFYFLFFPMRNQRGTRLHVTLNTANSPHRISRVVYKMIIIMIQGPLFPCYVIFFPYAHHKHCRNEVQEEKNRRGRQNLGYTQAFYTSAPSFFLVRV